MTCRSDRSAPDRAPPTLQSLIDRILAAELDPVQLASMHLHLSHLLRVRKDWVTSQGDFPQVILGLGSVEIGTRADG